MFLMVWFSIMKLRVFTTHGATFLPPKTEYMALIYDDWGSDNTDVGVYYCEFLSP